MCKANSLRVGGYSNAILRARTHKIGEFVISDVISDVMSVQCSHKFLLKSVEAIYSLQYICMHKKMLFFMSVDRLYIMVMTMMMMIRFLRCRIHFTVQASEHVRRKLQVFMRK